MVMSRILSSLTNNTGGLFDFVLSRNEATYKIHQIKEMNQRVPPYCWHTTINIYTSNIREIEFEFLEKFMFHRL